MSETPKRAISVGATAGEGGRLTICLESTGQLALLDEKEAETFLTEALYVCSVVFPRVTARIFDEDGDR